MEETGCVDAWWVVNFKKPKLPENLQSLIMDKFSLSNLLTELERYKGVIRDNSSIACN
jgi:hypothetical protein